MSDQLINFAEGYFYNDVERDFIDIVREPDMPKSMFVSSCQAMMGDDWSMKGKVILEQSAPDLVQKFIELTK